MDSVKFKLYYLLIIFLSLFSCKDNKESSIKSSNNIKESIDSQTSYVFKQHINYHKLFEENEDYISDGFDFPVGKPNAFGYYNAQKFQENNHLGDDWNGVGGGNSDLGDPIYATANGYISEAKDYEGGWGNVIRIVHLHKGKLYESLYAHCDSILVNANQFVKKGEQLGTIGNCNGTYYAHLHLEIRDSVNLDIGAGYSSDTSGYLDPSKFIKNNRN